MDHRQGGNGRGYDTTNGFPLGPQRFGGFQSGGQPGIADSNGVMVTPGVFFCQQTGSVNYNLNFTNPGTYHLNLDRPQSASGVMGASPIGGFPTGGMAVSPFGGLTTGSPGLSEFSIGGMNRGTVAPHSGTVIVNRRDDQPIFRQNTELGGQRNGGGLLDLAITNSANGSGVRRIGMVNQSNGNGAEDRSGMNPVRSPSQSEREIFNFDVVEDTIKLSEPVRFYIQDFVPSEGSDRPLSSVSTQHVPDFTNDWQEDFVDEFEADSGILSQQSIHETSRTTLTA